MIKEIDMIKLPRYKENLRIINNRDVYSYNTLVARINRGETHLTKLNWEIKRDWRGVNEKINTSPTTSKHINYIAEYYNLKIIDNV
tara:strand:- start:528 stop:785 length:258 start_codon:yes stop_codon:yes gene_type:complete